MTPVCETLFREFHSLRDLSVEIEERARAVELGDLSQYHALRMLGSELLERLEERVEREQVELLPALRTSFLWGTTGRAERREAQQEERRVLLRFQLETLADPDRPAALVACGLRDFARLIREELRQEMHLAPEALPLRAEVFFEVELG